MLPMEPKLGKMLILGAIFECLDPILTIVAGLSVRDPFLTPLDKKDVSYSCFRWLTNDWKAPPFFKSFRGHLKFNVFLCSSLLPSVSLFPLILAWTVLQYLSTKFFVVACRGSKISILRWLQWPPSTCTCLSGLEICWNRPGWIRILLEKFSFITIHESYWCSKDGIHRPA